MVDDNNSSNMDMGSMNTSSSTMMNMDSEMKRNYSLVNTADYQSAQALAAKALEIFNTELRPMASNNNNNTTAFITNLENGLTQLNNSIRSKASPMDIMMIVHTQVHPNLMQAFNLQLR
jgi:small-conductance mechanosensitive channel